MRREDRCPPVPLRILRILPDGSTRMYCTAAAEGRAMRPDGSFDALGPGTRPVGVRVTKVHRDRVLERLGIKERRWRQAVQEWVGLGLAHRCGKGILFLLLAPTNSWSPEVSCPGCSGTLTAAEAALSLPHNGTLSAANRHERGISTRDTEEGCAALVQAWGSPAAALAAARAKWPAVESITQLTPSQKEHLLAAAQPKSVAAAQQQWSPVSLEDPDVTHAAFKQNLRGRGLGEDQVARKTRDWETRQSRRGRSAHEAEAEIVDELDEAAHA